MSNDLHTYIEPELEARITALVLGEVGEFDVDELERIIQEQPELQIFRRRMEAMHDLLGETVKQEKDEAWQLSDDRRAELHRAFSRKRESAPAMSKTVSQAQWRAGVGVAACLLVCLVVFSMMSPIGLKRAELDQLTSEIVSYQVASVEGEEEKYKHAHRDKYDLGKDDIVWAPEGNDGFLEEEETGDAPIIGRLFKGEEGEDRSRTEVDHSISRGNKLMSLGVERKPSAPRSSMAKEIASNTRSSIAIPVPDGNVSGLSADYGDRDSFGDDLRGVDAVVMRDMQGNQPRALAMSDGEDDAFGGGEFKKNRVHRREIPKKSGDLTLALGDELAFRVGERVANEKPKMEAVLESGKVGFLAEESFDKGKKSVAKRSGSYRAASDYDRDHLLAGADKSWETEVPAEIEGLKNRKKGKSKPDAELAPKPMPASQHPQPLPEETDTSAQPISTFSLNVADVSFKLAKVALLEKGQWPESSKVRTEEFVNAFDYGDPSPRRGEPVACAIGQSAHPFLQQRNLLRIGMKTAALGRSTPLCLTVLLDNSGSMEREDRAASVLAAIQVLASQLGPQDKITLVSFARQPRLLADRISGDQAGQLVNIASNTPSEGGTNLEEALRLARKLAKRQHTEGAQDRVVLITDGVANLGNTVPEQLSREIEIMRQEGIAFDACGVGAEDLNDEILEALTRKGDGRYYFLNRPEDADSGFAKQLAGALSPAAKNVKVQVVFNPKRVSKYRLLGFEKHRLNKEDFRNDKVDAAEMAAEEAGNAVYQIEANPDGEGELGEVFVRFLDTSTGHMVERSWPLPYESQAKSFDLADPSMQLAAMATMLGEKLHGTDAGSVRFDLIAKSLGKLRAHYAADRKVQDLIRMCEKVK